MSEDAGEDEQFDIFDFMAKQSQTTGMQGIKKDTPPIIVQHRMEDMYSVPTLSTVNMFGEIVLTFSSPILTPSLQDIKSRLQKFGDSRKLDDVESSGADKGPGTIQEVLKASGSIMMKLVPGSDTDLKFKTFDWTLE